MIPGEVIPGDGAIEINAATLPKVLVNRRRLFVDPRHLRVRHLASKEAARRGREAARQLRLQEQHSSAA